MRELLHSIIRSRARVQQIQDFRMERCCCKLFMFWFVDVFSELASQLQRQHQRLAKIGSDGITQSSNETISLETTFFLNMKYKSSCLCVCLQPPEKKYIYFTISSHWTKETWWKEHNEKRRPQREREKKRGEADSRTSEKYNSFDVRSHSAHNEFHSINAIASFRFLLFFLLLRFLADVVVCDRCKIFGEEK